MDGDRKAEDDLDNYILSFFQCKKKCLKEADRMDFASVHDMLDHIWKKHRNRVVTYPPNQEELHYIAITVGGSDAPIVYKLEYMTDPCDENRHVPERVGNTVRDSNGVNTSKRYFSKLKDAKEGLQVVSNCPLEFLQPRIDEGDDQEDADVQMADDMDAEDDEDVLEVTIEPDEGLDQEEQDEGEEGQGDDAEEDEDEAGEQDEHEEVTEQETSTSRNKNPTGKGRAVPKPRGTRSSRKQDDKNNEHWLVDKGNYAYGKELEKPDAYNLVFSAEEILYETTYEGKPAYQIKWLPSVVDKNKISGPQDARMVTMRERSWTKHHYEELTRLGNGKYCVRWRDSAVPKEGVSKQLLEEYLRRQEADE